MKNIFVFLLAAPQGPAKLDGGCRRITRDERSRVKKARIECECGSWGLQELNWT